MRRERIRTNKAQVTEVEVTQATQLASLTVNTSYNQPSDFEMSELLGVVLSGECILYFDVPCRFGYYCMYS